MCWSATTGRRQHAGCRVSSRSLRGAGHRRRRRAAGRFARFRDRRVALPGESAYRAGMCGPGDCTLRERSSARRCSIGSPGDGTPGADVAARSSSNLPPGSRSHLRRAGSCSVSSTMACRSLGSKRLFVILPAASCTGWTSRGRRRASRSSTTATWRTWIERDRTPCAKRTWSGADGSCSVRTRRIYGSRPGCTRRSGGRSAVGGLPRSGRAGIWIEPDGGLAVRNGGHACRNGGLASWSGGLAGH